MTITIIHEDNNFLVVEKPHGLPSAPLCEGDISALNYVLSLYPEVKNVQGKKTIEGGLVHRIDTDTRGLLLFARNQVAYDSFLQQQLLGHFTKYYTAFCSTNVTYVPLVLPHTVTSRFRPFGEGRKMVKSVFEYSGRAARKKASNKDYSTTVLSIVEVENNTFPVNTVKVNVTITEGYRHQVRCHLAGLGLPILGDPLYGTPFKKNTMQFFASSLEFFHPVTGETLRFSIEL